MKISCLTEPELEFGGGGKHVDIRFGRAAHGPDAGATAAPVVIRVGLVGTRETVEGIHGWLAKCAGGIPEKSTPLTHLFPSFPGYGEDTCFRSRLVFGDALSKTVSNRAIKDLTPRTTWSRWPNALTCFTTRPAIWWKAALTSSCAPCRSS